MLVETLTTTTSVVTVSVSNVLVLMELMEVSDIAMEHHVNMFMASILYHSKAEKDAVTEDTQEQKKD